MAAHSAKLDPDNAEYLTISQASSYIHIESREKCMGVGLSLETEARVRGSVPTAASPTPPHHRSRRSAANSPRPPYCSPCLPAAARRRPKKQSARAVASRAARGCTVHRRLRGRHCACCAPSTRSTPPPSLSRRAGQQRFKRGAWHWKGSKVKYERRCRVPFASVFFILTGIQLVCKITFESSPRALDMVKYLGQHSSCATTSPRTTWTCQPHSTGAHR